MSKGVAGPSNFTTVPRETLCANIVTAINQAFLTAGLEPGSFDGAYLGLAGIVTDADREAVLQWLKPLRLARRVDVHHDARIALAGALDAKSGIIAVAGTGSSVYGRNPSGSEALVGGWGFLFGDEGSAYDIGRRGWMAAALAIDGRGPTTQLVAALQNEVGVHDLRQAVPRLLDRSAPVATTIASYAPLVQRVADAGDEVARQIVSEASRALVSLILAALRKLGLLNQPTDVALSGSLLLADTPMRRGVLEILDQELPHVRVRSPRFDPAVGAALLALQSDGILVDSGLIEHVQQSVVQRPSVT